jgi:hypothetical protein
MTTKSLLAIWFLISFLQLALNGKDAQIPTQKNQLSIPLNGAASLVIYLPYGIKPLLEQGADFVLYQCKVPGKDKTSFQATMTIYIGQRPMGLSDLVNSHKFFQEVAQFFRGRETWFSWVAEDGEEQLFHSSAYLYNIYTGEPSKDAPYVVHINIVGRDMENINALKTAAQTLRPKEAVAYRQK